MDLYEDLGRMMGRLEADVLELEMIILNGENEKANRYLRESADEIRRALASLSDAVFEVTTSPSEQLDL